MANPFLMTEEELSPQSNDLHSNPFLMESNEHDEETENPFMAQGVCNPFSDFASDGGGLPDPVDSTLISETAEYPINVNPATLMGSATTVGDNKKKPEDIDSAMSFFGTTITDHDELEDSQVVCKSDVVINKDTLTNEDIMGYTEDEAFEDQLTVRSVAPSRTTQDLILSVSDQLDQNSSHLLDRIPVTRTPSPVSMRDLHSPSPTPGFEDLLNITDELPDDNNQSMQPFQMSNDNPFASVVEPVVPTSKVEPARPPPPRPIPPRPTPPRRPSPPQVVAAPQRPPSRPAPPQTEVDLFDMFGSEATVEVKKAPAPKSNQDILNLFSVGTAAHSPAASIASADLLCDDIIPIDKSSTNDFGNHGQDVITTQHESPSYQSPVLVHDPEVQFGANEPLQPDFSIPHEDDVSEKNRSHKSTPSTDYGQVLTDAPASITPEYTVNASPTPTQEPDATLSFVEPTPFSDIVDEQMDTTVDSVLATPSTSVNPFSSPEEDRDLVSKSVPVIVAEEVLSFEPVPPTPKADLFDAFAAKFDSVKKEEPNLLDGFGPPSRSVSAEFGIISIYFHINIYSYQI